MPCWSDAEVEPEEDPAPVDGFGEDELAEEPPVDELLVPVVLDPDEPVVAVDPCEPELDVVPV